MTYFCHTIFGHGIKWPKVTSGIYLAPWLGQGNKVSGSKYVCVSKHFGNWSPNDITHQDRTGTIRLAATTVRRWCQSWTDQYQPARATCRRMKFAKIYRKRLQAKPIDTCQRNSAGKLSPCAEACFFRGVRCTY